MEHRFLHRLDRTLEQYNLYLLARDVKRSIEDCLRDHRASKVLSLVPAQPSLGDVLFSHKAAFVGFSLSGRNQPVPNTHNNFWESMRMVGTFLECGYSVDVISSNNVRFRPKKDYSILVDVRRNLQRLAPMLNDDCVKIMHLDTAHLLFHNAAESRRLLELQQRKGVTLRPLRYERPNLGLEHADCATTTGNAFTLGTFRYANKPIYRLPIASDVSCAWPRDKDWEACRGRFLWFSSGGLVHKGLDLALDAFREMPECHLTVCGPIEQEEDFVRAYRKELYDTPNILTVGWVDVKSPRFTDIARMCMGSVLFSCSEGASVSSMHCMHAGLIPILSYECGLDIDDFGFALLNCSNDNIKNTVGTAASLSAEEIETRARRTWECARANHTRERFAERYKEVVVEILSGKGHG